MNKYISLLVFSSTVGCMGFVDDGGQDGENPSLCQRVETALAYSDVSVLGFSAEELLDSVDTAATTPLLYADDTSTSLSMEIEVSTTDVLFVEHKGCGSAVEIQGVLSLVSDDGQFNESMEVVFTGSALGELSSFVSVDPTSIQGSYSLDPSETTGLSELEISVRASFLQGGVIGEINWQGTEESGDTVIRHSNLIAYWETD